MPPFLDMTIPPIDTIPLRGTPIPVHFPITVAPVISSTSPGLAVSPTTIPPSPLIVSPLVGTATGFQFSFAQVTLPPGATNVIAAYRVYRNSLNVFSRNLVHTFTGDLTNTGTIVFTDTIVPAAGLNYYYWVTSVDTFGNESAPQPAQCGTVAGSIGSTPYSNTPNFTYTSTVNSITWNWATMTIYRGDGTTTTIPSGSQLITGLGSSSTYQFFPYYDETLKSIEWVSAGGVGIPSFAYGAATQALYASQNLRTHIPLSISPMTAATTSGGSGGGSGGGGGGGGGGKQFV